MEVFLEEARGELAAIREYSVLWKRNLADRQALVSLRRAFHTLKGSGRVVGATAIGDFAWCFEDLLSHVLNNTASASMAMAELVEEAAVALEPLIGEAPVTEDALAALAALAARAAALLQGTPDEVVPTAIEPTKPAELVEVEPPPVAVAPAGPIRIELPPPVVQPPVPAEPVAAELESGAPPAMDLELAQVFQYEATEILDASDAILQRLGSEPDQPGLLNDLRRGMHTLKGSSRMAGFMTVGDLAHAAESVLDALGKGALQAAPAILDTVQRALDGLHRMLRGGGEPAPDVQNLIDELHGVLGGKPVVAPKPVAAPVAATRVAAMAQPTEKPAAAAPTDSIRVSAALLNTLVNQMGESSIFRARIDQGVNAMSFNLNELEQTVIRLRRQVTHLATQAEARIQSRQDTGAKAHQLEFDPLELDRFTELQQLSRSLMEIADDLGNVGNTLGEQTREVGSLLDQQAKVNKEIQQGLMRTGMVRFGSIVPRLRRVVRQAAQELGKRAELLVGGEEAEVDRTVLENMVAPLEHMLRNSLAHGIEAPEQRRTVGKPEIGTITLSLHREGAELVLELSDDGAGLNFDAIRAKGEEKGFLLPDQPASQEELIALLLRPGFSTAKAVTQIAGRGVGMDVVNAAIRAMRGALLIQTEPGQGSRFIVRLPFSLAVTQALLAKAGNAIFAIPLLSIELVTRIQESAFQAYLTGEQVQHQHNERGYPIHNLGILAGSEHMLPFEEVKDRRPPTLLFRSAEASAALQVEAVLGNQEIIVKPVSPQFNNMPGISGATVLGDGRVVVVLDLAALVRNIGSQQQKQAESRALRMARQEARQEKIGIMVIDDSITMRKVTA
ncbi:MAG: chemotaxis protein CheA, partial [Candidatus Competibacteraceae bacterium]